LEEKEEWLVGAENVADIGMLTVESVSENAASVGDVTQTDKSDAGCIRILLEGKYLFNAIDTTEDFEKYKVIILPDFIRPDITLKDKLDRYVSHGGKILATGKSGLWRDRDEFAIDFGIEYIGENEFKPDYFRPNFELKNFENTAFVMYSQGQRIKNISAEQLGTRENPYFNQTAEHFCSHQHTPSTGECEGTAMVYGGAGIYIAWNLFEDYAVKGSLILKETAVYALDMLLEKTLKTNLPAQGIATLTKQGDRLVNHLLYASPVKRGSNIEVIEDIVPLYNIEVELKLEKSIESVRLVPQMEDLKLEASGGTVKYVVPKLENHQMVVIT